MATLRSHEARFGIQFSLAMIDFIELKTGALYPNGHGGQRIYSAATSLRRQMKALGLGTSRVNLSMLRRDYILRMIEEFIRALARIRSLKQDQRWNDASKELDAEFQKLIGDGAQAVARLSETELLSRLMHDGPTHALRDKALILTTLLKESGDLAMAEGCTEDGHGCYLKALHLLLDTLPHSDVFECPEFVPKIELLRESLREASLPARTHASLMHHYERVGEFARAEDAFHAILETAPDNAAVMEFGVAFYQRLLLHDDAVLNTANLPRAEVEEGLNELQQRRESRK